MIKKIVAGVWIKETGEEICTDTAAGAREYARRRRVAWERQGGLCGICGTYVRIMDAETDHIKPRGMGGSRRDDRQENLQAVHHLCNSAKSSKRY